MNTIISSPKEGDIHTCTFIFLRTTPNFNPRGGGRHTTHMHIHFPMGPCPSLAQRGGGGGGMCLKCPPPPRSTYACGPEYNLDLNWKLCVEVHILLNLLVFGETG